jgi:hypothetical protein
MMYSVERYRSWNVVSAFTFVYSGRVLMKGQLLARVHRRDLFRLVTAGAVVAGTAALEPVAAESLGSDNKRRARYQANSTEVQEFYRVNRYPAK